MPDPDKRKKRQLKQAIKKRGTKVRRADMKRHLQANPESAHEQTESLGRYRSDVLNGLDQDSTRSRVRTQVSVELTDPSTPIQ